MTDDLDEKIKEVPNRFLHFKKELEKGVGITDPTSIEDRFKVVHEYFDPENEYAEEFAKSIESIVSGGVPGHEKGAKYHALKTLYSNF